MSFMDKVSAIFAKKVNNDSVDKDGSKVQVQTTNTSPSIFSDKAMESAKASAAKYLKEHPEAAKTDKQALIAQLDDEIKNKKSKDGKQLSKSELELKEEQAEALRSGSTVTPGNPEVSQGPPKPAEPKPEPEPEPKPVQPEPPKPAEPEPKPVEQAPSAPLKDELCSTETPGLQKYQKDGIVAAFGPQLDELGIDPDKISAADYDKVYNQLKAQKDFDANGGVVRFGDDERPEYQEGLVQSMQEYQEATHNGTELVTSPEAARMKYYVPGEQPKAEEDSATELPTDKFFNKETSKPTLGADGLLHMRGASGASLYDLEQNAKSKSQSLNKDYQQYKTLMVKKGQAGKLTQDEQSKVDAFLEELKANGLKLDEEGNLIDVNN